MDPLSTLLFSLKPESHMAGRFDLGADQSIAFPPYAGLKCYAVVEGDCILRSQASQQVFEMRTGDCFLLSGGHGFTISTSAIGKTVDFGALVAAMQQGLPGLYEGEPACTLAGGHFTFHRGPADLLCGMLPPVIRVQKSRKQTAMQWSLERMREEILGEQLGGSFLVQQLAYLMLVDVLRTHIAAASDSGVGWLYALADPQLRVALHSIQGEPAKPWTLVQLAQLASMSRSLFARRFREKVGETPMDYLTRWRMLLAGPRLSNTSESVLGIAMELGYQSESAFGKAFKRVTGYSPRKYKSQALTFPTERIT